MTGVSYRNGAGHWLDEEGWKKAVYRVNFPEHWVFAGDGARVRGRVRRGRRRLRDRRGRD